jgi:hypothetical protein
LGQPYAPPLVSHLPKKSFKEVFLDVQPGLNGAKLPHLARSKSLHKLQRRTQALGGSEKLLDKKLSVEDDEKFKINAQKLKLKKQYTQMDPEKEAGFIRLNLST